MIESIVQTAISFLTHFPEHITLMIFYLFILATWNISQGRNLDKAHRKINDLDWEVERLSRNLRNLMMSAMR